MDRKRRRKKITKFVAAAALLVTGFLWATNRAMLAYAEGRVYTSLDAIPERKVGLVLGTAPLVHGHKNPFFERRMDAAAALYQAHKIEKILVSGDNSRADYDEPTAMRDALKGRGVPEGDIVLDYAGFHTLDSIVRARNVFGVDRCTIVTDDFHLPRALYIAEDAGIDAVGYQTAPLPRSAFQWTYLREVSARSMTWLDLKVFHEQPKFLGPQIPVGLIH